MLNRGILGAEKEWDFRVEVRGAQNFYIKENILFNLSSLRMSAA